MQTYPKRESHFAIKFLHALNDAEVVTMIGERAVLLIQAVVLCEDRTRYTHAPKFWQGQLMARLGITCKKQFRRTRQQAIDSGLLHYASQGTRAQGAYWVLVPDWLLGRFSCLQEADSCSASGSQTAAATESIVVTCTPNQQESGAGLGGQQPPNQTDEAGGLGGGLPPNEQDRSRLGGGLGGGLGGNLPPPPIPTPKKEKEERPDSSSRDASASKKKKREPVFTQADHDTASWMAELLRKSNPDGRKKTPGQINSWANDIRLIRERDEKTDAEIRSLFLWANQDSFWSANIQSAGKLREKWDSLTAQRAKKTIAQPATTVAAELLPNLERKSK